MSEDNWASEERIISQACVSYTNDMIYISYGDETNYKDYELDYCIENKGLKKDEVKEYRDVTVVVYENDTIEIHTGQEVISEDNLLDELKIDRERQDIEDLTGFSSELSRMTDKEKRIYIDGYKHGWWAAAYESEKRLKDYRKF